MDIPNSERMLPSAEDAERAVLGGMLVDNRLVAEGIEMLFSDDFYSPVNRSVFSAIVTLHNKSLPIDPVTVSEVLRSEQTLDAAGGGAAITNLTYGLPIFDSIEHYATIVREKSVLRQTIRACSGIQTAAMNEDGTATELLERATSELQSLSDRSLGKSASAERDLSLLAAESLAAADNFNQRDLVKTGLIDLDGLLGGLEPGTVTIVGGRPGAGKTSLTNQISLEAGKTGYVVLMNSLEMSASQCMDRLIASEARVNLQDYHCGELPDLFKERARDAARAIGRLPIVIDDRSDLSPMLLKSRCRRIKAKRKRLDLVIVDYLQLMRSDGRSSHQDNRRLEIEAFSRSMKLLAKDLDVAVVCLSQLSRAPETRKPPKPVLSDLRESGAIEQDADVVVLIYRADQSDGNGVELIVAKNRNGPTGVAQAHFLGTSARFENLVKGGQ